METKSFAEQLIAARKAAGLTQEQLGEKMHMSRQGISHWENGRALPDAETLKQLSQALGYDFVTEAALTQPDEQSSPVSNPPLTAEKPFWKKPEFILSVAVTVLALLLMFVLLRPATPAPMPVGGTQLTTDPVNTAVPHPVSAARAEVRITPLKNPITPEIDPMLGATPWWIYRVYVQETAGVDFSIEKLTVTYRYRDGAINVVEQGPEAIAATVGSSVLRGGMSFQWNGAEPLLDYESINIRLDGTDAKGNKLAFEETIYTLIPDPTATPAIDPTQKAALFAEPVENPVAPITDPELGPDPLWFYTFNIIEREGVPVTLDKVTIITHATTEDMTDVFDAATITGIFGTNVLPGGSALPWTGGLGVHEAITGVSVVVEGTDQNGNAVRAEGSLTFMK